MSTRSLVRPEGSPTLRYCHESHRIKQEDIIFVYDDLQKLSPHRGDMGKWDLFCLCDGHGGREAAEYAQEHLPYLIAAKLPVGPQPDTETQEGMAWLEDTRKALDKAFRELDLSFQKQCAYPNVGCTMTVALFCGWVLTIANIGDSEAFLDLGKGEQLRLKHCGNQISALSEGFFRPALSNEEGIGPLRVWPSGLAVSRAIGDQDCGHAILASPHIQQIKIPFSGARLVAASDGLWDHLAANSAIKRSRKHNVKDVPNELISKARDLSEYGLTDDTSVLVIDVVPTPKIDFKEISKKIRGPKSVISRLSKRFGKNKGKDASSVVLMATDMAEVQATPVALDNSNAFLSSKSINSQKGRPPKPLSRQKTFAGPSKAQNESSESEDDPEENQSAIGLSLNLDLGEGPSESLTMVGTRSLERFHSSTLI